jgi:hypothetical protein
MKSRWRKRETAYFAIFSRRAPVDWTTFGPQKGFA